MAKLDGVRILNPKFKKALILEEPDRSLDEYLRQQGIEPQRLPNEMTQDVGAVLEILRQGQHDLIYKRSRFIIEDEVLSASDNLAAIMLCCIGDDSVDKQACARQGVLVMNDPISNARSVVEMVFGEMVCLGRRIFDSNDECHHHKWSKNNKGRYELKGKTLGILGLGNIGKQVAQMGEAFGMKIAFFDDQEVAREVGRALGWQLCSNIEDLFRSSDFLTVHVSSENSRGQSNLNMLNYDHFKLLGQSCGENSPRIFINAGRGFLFEPDELNRAVAEGLVQAAAVDVFPEEPGSGADAWVNPFAAHPNIIATPHIGAATQEAQPRIAAYVSGTTHLFNTFGTVRSCVYSPGKVIGINDTERADTILAVVHSDARGTKKAISDAIFEAGRSYLQSSHRDFIKYGFAYDVSAMDGSLTSEQLQRLIDTARQISGDPAAIRAIRQLRVEH